MLHPRSQPNRPAARPSDRHCSVPSGSSVASHKDAPPAGPAATYLPNYFRALTEFNRQRQLLHAAVDQLGRTLKILETGSSRRYAVPSAALALER